MSVTGEQLREAVKKRFTSLRRSDTMTTWALSKIREGTATFALVEKYAARLGELLSEAMTAEITEAALPGGMLTAEMAEEILRPLLQEAYEMVNAAAAETMQSLNNAAGLGMKAIRPAIEKDRIDGLIEKITSYESFEQASWLLQEPVVEFTQHVCDRLIEDNVDAHFEAGLSPKVTRKAESGCCKWCSNLDGEYDYPVDREVYRRHRNCRCLVLYDPRNGIVQDVHTKSEYDSIKEAEQAEKAERRRQKLEKWEEESARYPEARKEILRRIRSGEYSLKLKHQKYLQHTKKAVQYKNATEGRMRNQSYLTISEKDAQKIINQYSGLGDPQFDNKGNITGKEFFSTGHIIGEYYDSIQEKYIPTDRVAICHGKNGSHIYPVNPREM